MKDLIEIEVTETHINAAQHYANKGFTRCQYCPIALAARDAGLDRATASSRGIAYVDPAFGEVRWTEPLPEVAQQFIRAFDANRPVEPFGFVVAFREAA